MKKEIESRKPEGLLDYLSIALSTFGVGYFPIAPGTWGSAVGVLIYLGIDKLVVYLAESYWRGRSQSPPPFVPTDFQTNLPDFLTRILPSHLVAWVYVGIAISLLFFCIIGIWAAGRSTEFFGNSDPSHAVVDEVIGQLIVFLFVPFGIGWPFILAGFLLFRLFDIWKPYPIDDLQNLPGGLGVCADDILAGVYAGVCLSVIYAVSLSI